MSSKRQSPKFLLKKNDGEPLTRADLQFDVLQRIFSDTNEVFTDPFHSQIGDRPARSRVTFRDLYVNAIINSPKASKMLKDKMAETPEFATHFAMLSLLTNVGRINTTMSFFHEMKTLIRTFHPVPALQKDNNSLQDAPRLKGILKAIVYEPDAPKVATTLRDCRSRIEAEITPPTHIANLLFILANESASISKLHFSNEFEFLDLFCPCATSSISRARAFLWLVYKYYESSTATLEEADATGDISNPFSDAARPGQRPVLDELTEAETAMENVDPPDEKVISDRLLEQRARFLANQSAKSARKGVPEDDESVISVDSTAKPKAKRRGAGASAKSRKSAVNEGHAQNSSDEASLDHPAPSRLLRQSSPFRSSPLQPKQPRRISYNTGPRYSPYPNSRPTQTHETRRISGSQGRLSPPRTLLQHAWHVVARSDPLADSDDEVGDEHYRHDYVQRLNVVCRLRGKSPTPEPG